ERAKPGDNVVVFLLGHGSGEGKDSRVDIPGADARASDYAMWVSPFAKQNVVFINASSASGDFVDALKGPGRVVVTATKTSFERNESLFAGPFVGGFGTGEADADKDGRISVLEAFDFAKRETAKKYETEKKLM